MHVMFIDHRTRLGINKVLSNKLVEAYNLAEEEFSNISYIERGYTLKLYKQDPDLFSMYLIGINRYAKHLSPKQFVITFKNEMANGYMAMAYDTLKEIISHAAALKPF